MYVFNIFFFRKIKKKKNFPSLNAMSLSYSSIAGVEPSSDHYQVARDGEFTIYYNDEPIDILREHEPEVTEELVTDLVDNVVEGLRMFNLTTRKLIDVDADIMAKEPPKDRYGKRIYSAVKDQLAARESKIFRGRFGIHVIPRLIPGQTDRYYIFAQSGSGKSTWASRYAQDWLIYHPGGNIFIFSRKEFDPVFDGVIPNLTRVVLDRNFVREHSQKSGEKDPIRQYENALVIFDDFLKIEDQTIRKAAEHLKNSIYELGRQYNTDIISIQHKGLGGMKSIIELCESTAIVCFPRMNLNESIKVATKLDFSKEQLNRIFDEETKLERWLAIIRPNIIVTEHLVKIID